MNIRKHIDEKTLSAWQSELFIFIGLFLLTFSLFLGLTKGKPTSLIVVAVGILALGFLIARCVVPYHRFKKAVATLQQQPDCTFTQLAAAMKLEPKAVRAIMATAMRRGVLVNVRIDEAGDRLVSTARTTRRARVESLLTVTCPNCGAACEISSVYGGQCEYCDTHLPGKE